MEEILHRSGRILLDSFIDRIVKRRRRSTDRHDRKARDEKAEAQEHNISQFVTERIQAAFGNAVVK